uniref:Uncharacterized protein n=1 Tax=Arundo donax TaxID=35708 RepID=A0A0A9B0U5_ARUDO
MPTAPSAYFCLRKCHPGLALPCCLPLPLCMTRF